MGLCQFKCKGLSVLPIFRPLLTYDKQEIIDLAKKIGTYNISIKAYKDCCSIVARRPSTKTKMEIIERVEKELDMEKIIKMSLDMAETVEFDIRKQTKKPKTTRRNKKKV